MRRRKINTAVNGKRDVRVQITIVVDSRAALTRGELGETIDSLASAVMRAVPGTEHFHPPLSEVRCR